MVRLFFLVCFVGMSAAFGQTTYPEISALNTSLDEQCPVLSPDGKFLFFSVADNPQNVGGKTDLGDIWYSVRTATGWSKPIHGGKLINNNLHNTVAGFSPDGSQLFIMGHYASMGKPVATQGISVSVRTGDTWSMPVNINVPYFKNKRPYQSGALSDDGTVLVFSAEGYTTFGAEDIYVSRKVDGKWTEPVTLGPVINTKFQDVSPSLSPDTKRLYFASNGHKGKGSFDIFYSDRLDDTWKKWSKPVNMGVEVNSEGRELFYRVTKAGAFFTVARNSDGQADLKFIPSQDTVSVPAMINPTEEIKVVAVDTVAKIKEVVYEKKDDGKAKIFGVVTDAKTGQVIANATVHFDGSNDHQVATGQEGRFEVWVAGVDQYTVKVEAPGHIGEFERLDLKTQVVKELEMNFKLPPVEIGTTINLRSVLFERSKPILLASSYDELDMVADFMKTNPKIEILLSGHTDNQGRHDQNMKLSRERVEVVKKYLISKGIDEKRIAGKGFGGTKPIADNYAEDTRALNRRVEFTIVKD